MASGGRAGWACLLAIAAGLLGACAPAVRFPVGEAMLRGEEPAAAPAPDSLRAEVELTGYKGRSRTTVSAGFSALPLRKYKLDVYGLPGMVEASFLWMDTGWTLVVYGREGYLLGYGDTVDIPALGLEKAPVHDLFACLWGDFFPGDGEGVPLMKRGAGPEAAGRDSGDSAAGVAGKRDPEDSATGGSGGPRLWPARWEQAGDGLIRYVGRGGPSWLARLDAKSGVVLEAVREDSALRIAYEGYAVRGSRLLPRRVKVFSRGKPLLDLGIGAVQDNPAWKRDPFRVRIPKGFIRLRAAPGH